MKKVMLKSILGGGIALISMAAFYLLIMFLTMTAGEVWFNFKEFWYLIVSIIVGFGVQVGLYVQVKNCGHQQASKALPGASGAISGTAMVACCVHHLADVLPILGISGAAIFLAQYQRPFLRLGLAINLLGIAYMLNLLRKQKIMMAGVHHNH